MQDAGEANPPAGWYTDPTQVDSQRFWDGEAWTEHRAPAAAPRAAASSLPTGPLVGLFGSAVVLASTFMPLAESSQFLRVADNSLIQSGNGFLAIAVAVGMAIASLGGMRGERSWTWLAFLGLLCLVGAAWISESDLLLLTSANDDGLFNLGTEQASPGLGVYALGLGGVLGIIGAWVARSEHRSD